MSSLHSKSSTKPSSIPLYRRLLFPDLPSTAPVPPILPQASVALNTELYDFLALALRAYINPWWSKITRYDNEFIPQVADVIATVVRVLVTRLEKADIETLVFRAVPAVLAQHYADYRSAAAKVGSAYANGGAATLSQLFHQHQSHMAIDVEGNIDSAYVRHLIELILHECLPAEDQESDAERAIIREVIVKVLMQDVIPLLSQPWFINRLILDQLTSGQEKRSNSPKVDGLPQTRNSSTSFHSIVISVLSAVQYLSGLCLMLIYSYKQTANVVKRVNASPELLKPRQEREFARSILKSLSEVLNAKSRTGASVLFDVAEYSLELVEGFADRFLVYTVQSYVMTEQQVINIVRLSKRALFPNGYPGPPPAVPTMEEQVVIKERLVEEIGAQFPSFLSGVLLGPGSMRRVTILEVLEPLSSQACNMHLILFLFDLIVLTLFPEFGVQEPPPTTEDGGDGSFSKTASLLSPSPSPSPEPENGNLLRETTATGRLRSGELSDR